MTVTPMRKRGRWCDEHQRRECTRNRKDGTPCHSHRLVADSDRCRMHLGTKAAPVIAEAALNQQAARELARLDVPPVTDPLTELAKVAAQAVAWKNAMGEKVNELTSLRYEAAAGTGEQLRAEIALWERALDRCVATLAAMAKLNIEDRLAGVRKQTADMLERALDAALEASGTGLDGKQKAREAFRQNLRIVA
jgi:hypothetical protein